EKLRAPSFYPLRDATGSDAPNDRVRQLVGEDALEQFRALLGAADRHPNAAIVLARGPAGRARDVAELLLGIEDRDDCAGGELAELRADSTERQVEDVRGLPGQRL